MDLVRRAMRKHGLAAILLAAAFAASADETAVRRMVEGKLGGGGQVESVQKMPFDLYEVVVRTPEGPAIYYADSRATVIIAGKVFDATSGRNLTEERQRKLSAIKWESLPLQWAITTVRGSGRRSPSNTRCR